MRKVAGEADKLRQLGKLIQRLRRPGIVYCATVRAVDELYVALRHGKIPVERYNGKMTTDEREKAQASFMQPGRKVVMLATNAFGLGIDKPDIRYIIHYQMPGSPESYVQEAGRAGRDGKPARCVLLFQPDDIAIQEHFLKEAHPTKIAGAHGGRGPLRLERRGQGSLGARPGAVDGAARAARARHPVGAGGDGRRGGGQGGALEGRRAQADARADRQGRDRCSRRGASRIGGGWSSLLSYMNTQSAACRCCARTSASPRATSAGCAIRDAGLDSEVFDPGVATTSGTGCTRRPTSTRGRGDAAGDAAPARKRPCMRPRPRPAPPPAPGSRPTIPSDILPPLPPFEVPPPPDSEQTFDEGLWAAADAGAGDAMPGDAVVDMAEHDTGAAPAQVDTGAAAETETGAVAPAIDQDFNTGWAAIRDANIRPYAEWRAGAPVTLPVLVARPVSSGGHRATTPATTAVAAVAATATITGARRAGRQIRRRRRAAGAAGAAANGSGGGGATATATTAATATGAIITGTAIASADPGCRVSTIQAATNVRRCQAATNVRRCQAATERRRCQAGTSVRAVARRII